MGESGKRTVLEDDAKKIKRLGEGRIHGMATIKLIHNSWDLLRADVSS